MWECCNCVQINKSSLKNCEACGHEKCRICEEIEIPSSMKSGEDIYYFNLYKFYKFDNKLDPIEITRLKNIATEYSLNSDQIIKIFKEAKITIPDEVKISNIPADKNSPNDKKDVELKTVNDKPVKSFEHKPKPIKRKPSKKKGLIALIIILVVIIACITFIFIYKPGNYISTFSSFKSTVKSVHFSKAGNILAGCSGEEIIIFNLKTGKIIARKKSKATLISVFRKYIFTNDKGRTYYLKNLKTLTEITRFNTNKAAAIRFIKRGTRVCVIKSLITKRSNNTLAEIYSLRYNRLLAKRFLRGKFLAQSPNGYFVLTTIKDKLYIWNINSRALIKRISRNNLDIIMPNKKMKITDFFSGILSISNDLKFILYTRGKTSTIINVKTGKKSYLKRYIIDFINTLTRAAVFSDKGKFVATAEGKKIHLWKIK